MNNQRPRDSIPPVNFPANGEDTVEQFQIRDRRGGGWFWLHNDLIKRAGPHIGPIGIAVYSTLAMHASEPDQTCHPSFNGIAKSLGISRRKVIETIKQLEKYRMIQVERFPEAARFHRPNTYILTPPSTWTLPGAGKEPASVVNENSNRNEENYQASAPHAPGLVNHMHQTGARSAPKQESPNKTQENKTHHHQGDDGDDAIRSLKKLEISDPQELLARALKEGWTLSELVDVVDRIRRIPPDKVTNPAGLLVRLIPQGYQAALKAVERYLPTQHQEERESEKARLIREYESYIRLYLCKGLPEEDKEEAQARGLELRSKLQALGIDPDAIKSRILESIEVIGPNYFKAPAIIGAL